MSMHTGKKLATKKKDSAHSDIRSTCVLVQVPARMYTFGVAQVPVRAVSDVAFLHVGCL
jgi:hypothetical protein